MELVHEGFQQQDVFLFRIGDRFGSLGRVHGKRLFAEHGFARVRRALNPFQVQVVGQGNKNSIDVF
jgi:hypothetical protein